MRKTLLTCTIATLFSTSSFANIGNGSSDFGIFDTDTATSHWIGGGKSDAVKVVSQEFADITGGSKIHLKEIQPLFAELVSGKSKTEAHGIENVTLNFVTPYAFGISYPGGKTGTTDTVVFVGSFVEDVISEVAAGNIDIKDKNSRFAALNTDLHNNIWIGGGASDARRIVSEEFAEITGGSKIDCNKRGKKEIESLFSGLVNDSTGGWNGYKGIENVALIGLTADSFTVSIKGSQISTDRIEFTGECAKQAILASDQGIVDTKDPKSKFAIVDDQSVFLGGAVESVSAEFKALVGNRVEPQEAEKVLSALVDAKNGGIEGVRLLGVDSMSFAIELDSSGPGKETILFKGPEAENAYINVVQVK